MEWYCDPRLDHAGVCRSKDAHRDGIRCLAVYAENNIDLATSDQAAGEAQIDLVQAYKLSLRAGCQRLGRLSPDGGGDGRQAGSLSEPKVMGVGVRLPGAAPQLNTGSYLWEPSALIARIGLASRGWNAAARWGKL
jgi:hypothetical protein